jgi:hypothetical protein
MGRSKPGQFTTAAISNGIAEVTRARGKVVRYELAVCQFAVDKSRVWEIGSGERAFIELTVNEVRPGK